MAGTRGCELESQQRHRPSHARSELVHRRPDDHGYSVWHVIQRLSEQPQRPIIDDAAADAEGQRQLYHPAHRSRLWSAVAVRYRPAVLADSEPADIRELDVEHGGRVS